MFQLQDAKGLVACALGVDVETLTDDAGLGNPPEWDSAGHMFIVVNIEEKLGLVVDDNEVVTLTNLEAIALFLRRMNFNGA